MLTYKDLQPRINQLYTSDRQLAKAVGIPPSTLSRIKRGHVTPQPCTLTKIFLHITTQEREQAKNK